MIADWGPFFLALLVAAIPTIAVPLDVVGFFALCVTLLVGAWRLVPR